MAGLWGHRPTWDAHVHDEVALSPELLLSLALRAPWGVSGVRGTCWEPPKGAQKVLPMLLGPAQPNRTSLLDTPTPSSRTLGSLRKLLRCLPGDLCVDEETWSEGTRVPCLAQL